MGKTKEAPIAVEVQDVAGRRVMVPADAWAQEELAALPRGVRFHVYITIAKSAVDDEHGRMLTRYMMGISELYDWLPNTGPGTEFPTATHLRRFILIELGFCETWPQRDGTVRRQAHSMARDHMSFEDLSACLEMTRTYVLAYTEAVTGTAFEPWKRWEDEHATGGAQP